MQVEIEEDNTPPLSEASIDAVLLFTVATDSARGLTVAMIAVLATAVTGTCGLDRAADGGRPPEQTPVGYVGFGSSMADL